MAIAAPRAQRRFALPVLCAAELLVALTGHGLAGARESEKGLASGVLQTSTHLGGAVVLALLATVAAGGDFAAGCLAACAIGLLGALAARFLLRR
jgi:hypothetical protein